MCEIKKKYNIKKENLLGHSDIAPLRKIDPGEKFPWKKLSTHNLGKWYSKKLFTKEVAKKSLRLLFFKNLKKIGYKYFNLNKRSKRDRKLIKIFQQHFVQNNVTGRLDKETFQISQLLTL